MLSFLFLGQLQKLRRLRASATFRPRDEVGPDCTPRSNERWRPALPPAAILGGPDFFFFRGSVRLRCRASGRERLEGRTMAKAFVGRCDCFAALKSAAPLTEVRGFHP